MKFQMRSSSCCSTFGAPPGCRLWWMHVENVLNSPLFAGGVLISVCSACAWWIGASPLAVSWTVHVLFFLRLIKFYVVTMWKILAVGTYNNPNFFAINILRPLTWVTFNSFHLFEVGTRPYSVDLCRTPEYYSRLRLLDEAWTNALQMGPYPITIKLQISLAPASIHKGALFIDMISIRNILHNSSTYFSSPLF